MLITVLAYPVCMLGPASMPNWLNGLPLRWAGSLSEYRNACLNIRPVGYMLASKKALASKACTPAPNARCSLMLGRDTQALASGAIGTTQRLAITVHLGQQGRAQPEIIKLVRHLGRIEAS